jgi:hypothetical protein
MTYETPKVSDYGDLAAVTAATGSGTVEDGSVKSGPHTDATFGSQATGG